MDASRRVEFKVRLKDTEMIDEMKQLLESLDQDTIAIGAAAQTSAQPTATPEATANPQ